MRRFGSEYVKERPWDVGSLYAMVDGQAIDIVRIVGYLDEDDCVAPTKVIYHVDGYDPGFMFAEEVERAMNLGFFRSIHGAVVIGR